MAGEIRAKISFLNSFSTSHGGSDTTQLGVCQHDALDVSVAGTRSVEHSFFDPFTSPRRRWEEGVPSFFFFLSNSGQSPHSEDFFCNTANNVSLIVAECCLYRYFCLFSPLLFMVFLSLFHSFYPDFIFHFPLRERLIFA